MLSKSSFAFPVLALVLCAALSAVANGQCILANPSFEIAGSGGPVFGGWNQFGAVGSVVEASHGAMAARVSGPDYGGWDVSGYWQSQDCVPGEQWEATGHVLHPSGNPLTGDCVALVNIEWRDSGDNLIDYDSFTVATPTSQTDEYIDFSVLSGPAPTGTVVVRILLGVLQSPADPSPDVYYDQVTFFSTTPPTIDDQQWGDFPGGTTLTFGGRTWRVKGPGWFGPGYNYFSNSSNAVWVDAGNRLHLTLEQQGSTWVCTEVVTEEALGYGDYILTTEGRLDLIDTQTVLGLFLWEYGPCWDYGYLWWNAFNEVDIEYSRWGSPGSSIAQFVAQPYDYPGNISRFDATFGEDEVVSHAMRWLSDRVEYRVWRGGPDDESVANLIHSWTYSGPHVPRPEQPRLHLNFWLIDGAPAADQEIVFQDFVFVPDGGNASVESGTGLPAAAAGRLRPAAPNPFNPRTAVRYELDRDGFAEIRIYDASGRLVRKLVGRAHVAGEHETIWDGRDGAGHVLASGVYLVRLSGSDFVETQPVTLIK